MIRMPAAVRTAASLFPLLAIATLQAGARKHRRRTAVGYALADAAKRPNRTGCDRRFGDGALCRRRGAGLRRGDWGHSFGARSCSSSRSRSSCSATTSYRRLA